MTLGRLAAFVALSIGGGEITMLAQGTQIPSAWFSAAPETVLSDPLFPTLQLSTRREILAQIDPKFAKMKTDQRDRYLWQAETKYLPKPTIAARTFVWKPNDPSSTTSVGMFGVITKALKGEGFRVEASIQRMGFLAVHLRIVDESIEGLVVRPQTFVLEVNKPKRSTLHFEYPSRVSYQFLKAALDYAPTYVPTERSTIRSGSGQTLATVDSPDTVAKQEMGNATRAAVSGTIAFAGTVEPNALKEKTMHIGESVEGDVYFEVNSKATELVLKVVLSDIGVEIPLSLSK